MTKYKFCIFGNEEIEKGKLTNLNHIEILLDNKEDVLKICEEYLSKKRF